jgi:hypothetical protein
MRLYLIPLFILAIGLLLLAPVVLDMSYSACLVHYSPPVDYFWPSAELASNTCGRP